MKRLLLAIGCLAAVVTGYAATTADSIHAEVRAADQLSIYDYTIPSYVIMWVAREAARTDSSEANLQTLRNAVAGLQSKYEPYCRIVNINGDPRTRMAFNWFTNDSVLDGVVQLVAKDSATEADFTDPIEIAATTERTKALHYAVKASGILRKTGMSANQKYRYISHKALATDLTPATTYSYRVGFAGHWSEIATFHTAAQDTDKISFIYMTDSHIENNTYVKNARWCGNAAAQNDGDVDFCVFPGDFVETGTDFNSEWEWERWFEESMRAPINKMPFVVTDGNHDDTNLLNYDVHFNTDRSFNQRPLTVKPQFSGITYSFMYGDVLFLVYSLQDYWREDGEDERIAANTSSYLKTDVGNWFREQVEAHPEAKLRIALSHKNVFSGSGHQSDVETPLFRAMMLPIFADCEIDLALQGHDHCYEIIGPVNPWTRTAIDTAIVDVQSVTRNSNTNETGKYGGTFTVNDGTLYFVGATCGAKRYGPQTRTQMDAKLDVHKVVNYYDLFTSMFGQPGKPSYSRFDIEGSVIKVKSYTAAEDGTSTLFHEFTIQRTREHGMPTGYEAVEQGYDLNGTQKVLSQGHLLLINNNRVYNAQGQLQ